MDDNIEGRAQNMTTEQSETAQANVTNREGVDYLWCDECHKHVPSIRLQPGVWEVQCPRCIGECGLCSCKLKGRCVGGQGDPVQSHLYIAKPHISS